MRRQGSLWRQGSLLSTWTSVLVPFMTRFAAMFRSARSGWRSGLTRRPPLGSASRTLSMKSAACRKWSVERGVKWWLSWRVLCATVPENGCGKPPQFQLRSTSATPERLYEFGATRQSRLINGTGSWELSESGTAYAHTQNILRYLPQQGVCRSAPRVNRLVINVNQ